MPNKHFYKFDYAPNFACDYYELGDGLPSVKDVCDEVAERIANDDNAYISDIINEVSDSSVDIYTASLLQSCTSIEFQKFIDQSIAEMGLPNSNKSNFMVALCQQAQYVYYQQAIYENIDAIITNALINTLESEMLMIECSDEKYYELEDKLYEFIENYMEELELNNSDKFSQIVDDFYENLSEKLEEEKGIDEVKKLSDNTDDDDFMVRGLIIEPQQKPREIKIHRQDELKQLQKAVDGLIDMHTIINPATEKEYCIVLNDEGKLIGLPFNFPLYNRYYGIEPDGVMDAIVGTALLFRDDGSDLSSLSDDEIKFWTKELRPELSRDEAYIGSILLDSGEPSEWDLSDFENDDEFHTDYEAKSSDDIEI